MKSLKRALTGRPQKLGGLGVLGGLGGLGVLGLREKSQATLVWGRLTVKSPDGYPVR